MDCDTIFDESLKIGSEGEELLRLIAKAYIARGESVVEVKNDKLVSKTGNVYVEHECRGKPSGIAISTSPYWAIVLDGPNYKREVIVIIRATRLREICKQSGYRNVKGGDSNTSRGYLMSVVRLLRPLPPSLKGG